MTLNEAIEHLEDVLEHNSFSCKECRNEHKQLLDWLIELKNRREREGE